VAPVNDSIGDQSSDRAPPDAESLVERGILTARALDFLELCLASRLNLAISGPSSSGKRALLHSLVPYLTGDGQILAVQNPDEPSLERPGITSLRAHLESEDGGPGISRHYLLSLVPKMHPTGLILDRVEGAEAVPLIRLLLAMDGVMFSIVAESPADALLTLENLARTHGEGAEAGWAGRILSTALQLIVQLGTVQDGATAVVSLTEVCEAEEGCRELREIFAYGPLDLPDDEQTGPREHLRPTGVRPLFLDRIQTLGIPVPEHIFV
jgi:pilus assembly protein CpaF